MVLSISKMIGNRCHAWSYGEWRSSGFKSEFWVAYAEAMTMECVYADAGAHPTPDVLAAWSTLLGAVFGWVRDGFYEQLRNQRRRLGKQNWRSSSGAATTGTF